MESTANSCVNQQRGDAFYDRFYANGGWQYSFWREFWWHRRHVFKRFRLRRGMRLLEAACGNGFHTDLFRRMGVDSVGVDRSPSGIEWARKHHPRSQYVCCDLREMPFEPASFDVVLARGCSFYHYDLFTDEALGTTSLLLRYLKSGGVFIMIIVTDRSGRRDADQVWQNTLDDYHRHFAAFNRPYSVDWVDGMAVCGLFHAPSERPSSQGVHRRLSPIPGA